MKVLVCGHRNFLNYKLLSEVLDKIYYENHKPEDHEFVIISGEAIGADFLAKVWVNEAFRLSTRMKDHYEGYPADWKKYGKKAGFMRNQQMLDAGKPDLVIAFIDLSRDWSGTHDMVQKAKKAGVDVKEIDVRIS